MDGDETRLELIENDILISHGVLAVVWLWHFPIWTGHQTRQETN